MMGTDIYNDDDIDQAAAHADAAALGGFDVFQDSTWMGWFETHTEAFAFVLNSQPQSVDYATKYGGWSIESA